MQACDVGIIKNDLFNLHLFFINSDVLTLILLLVVIVVISMISGVSIIIIASFLIFSRLCGHFLDRCFSVHNFTLLEKEFHATLQLLDFGSSTDVELSVFRALFEFTQSSGGP